MKGRHEPVSQPEGQSASRPERLVTQPCPDCFSQAAGVTFQLPREGRRACLSVVLLPPPLLSSVVFPCWFPASCLEAGGARWPLRPSEGLAGVVVPHLFVAKRFLPTSRGQWHQEHRAPTQHPCNSSGISPQYVVRSWVLPYLFTGWDVMGLRFLASSCRSTSAVPGLNSEPTGCTFRNGVQFIALFRFSVFGSVLLFCLFGLFKNVATSARTGKFPHRCSPPD